MKGLEIVTSNLEETCGRVTELPLGRLGYLWRHGNHLLSPITDCVTPSMQIIAVSFWGLILLL